MLQVIYRVSMYLSIILIGEEEEQLSNRILIFTG